jgi:glycosyltransferase involved in cell wall biosynthesis
VQRWLKFVKYLPQFGWTPYVFTPENPSFSIRDESLLKDVPPEAEVMRFPIWEPYEIFLKLSGSDVKSLKPTQLVSHTNKSIFKKIATWIRGNFFIPDPRIFWVRPSVSFLDDFIRQNRIKSVITTGPPHSLHLIGYRLKKRNPSIKWIADFRDPWTQWGFLDTIKVGAIARMLHRRLESKVLSTADHIVTITPFYVRQFSSLSKRKVTYLPNGFDEDDFRNFKRTKTDRFLIRHAGIINEKCDPRPFMSALLELIREHDQFANLCKLEFIGEVHPSFRAFVESDPTLNSITVFSGNVPHKELLSRYGESSLLLIVLHGYKDAEGYMPGKLFEYLATGIPILGIGPVRGDAADLLRETGAGKMFEASDIHAIKDKIIGHFSQWNANIQTDPKSPTTQFSRKELTRKLTELL